MAGRNRERWLDGLKGFAILLVILGHVLSGYLDAGTFPEAYGSFYPVRTWIYSFHMPLFFLLSGFTFTLAYWQDGKLRRSGFLYQLFNLFWIYVLFALIQWGVKQAVPDMVNDTYDLIDLQRMLVVPLGNFWYIYVLFVIYVLAAVLRMPNWPGQFLLLPGAIAIIAADSGLEYQSLTVYRIAYHFFFFALGGALCRRRHLLRSPHLAGAAAMWLAVIVYYALCFRPRFWYANWKFGIAVTISFLLLCLFTRLPRLGELPLFQVCGRHCLEIYLLHTFFTAGLRSLLPLLGITTPWCSVWVNFVLSTAACLILSVFLARFRWSDLLFRPARLLRQIHSGRRSTFEKGETPHGPGKNSGE